MAWSRWINGFGISKLCIFSNWQDSFHNSLSKFFVGSRTGCLETLNSNSTTQDFRWLGNVCFFLARGESRHSQELRSQASDLKVILKQLWDFFASDVYAWSRVRLGQMSICEVGLLVLCWKLINYLMWPPFFSQQNCYLWALYETFFLGCEKLERKSCLTSKSTSLLLRLSLQNQTKQTNEENQEINRKYICIACDMFWNRKINQRLILKRILYCIGVFYSMSD